MPFLAFLRLLTPRAWAAIGLAVLIAALGVQTLRLNHAKADQFDRSACVKGEKCRPPKWKAEVVQLRPALAAAQRDFATCKANTTTLQGAIDTQNARVAALGAETARQLTETRKAQADARAVAESYRRAATSILTTKSGPDACKSAGDLIAEAVR